MCQKGGSYAYPLNRAQLAAVFQQDRRQEIVRILDQHNIPSQVRTMDRTSPSVFSMGTRERAAPFFQDPAQSWQYVIYVARKDLKPPAPSLGWMESGRRTGKI